MKFTSQGVLVVVVFAVWLFHPGEVHACSCLRAPDAKAALDAADQVVVGRVAEVTRADSGAPRSPGAIPELRVKLDIERSYKGTNAASLEVFTASNSAACGYPFKRGERYLVYAYTREDGKVAVSLCSRTESADQAAADIAVLDQSSPAKPESSREPQPSATGAPRAEPGPDVGRPPESSEEVAPAPRRPALEAASPPAVKQPPAQRGCACSLASRDSAVLTASLLFALLLLFWWRARSSMLARRGRG